MVLVKVDPVVVLTTSVSATSRVLPVLPDPAVSVRHVTSQLPGLLLASGHDPLISPLKRDKALVIRSTMQVQSFNNH